MSSTLLSARVPTIPSHYSIKDHACSMSLHVNSPVGLGVLPKDHRTLHVFKFLLIAMPLLSCQFSTESSTCVQIKRPMAMRPWRIHCINSQRSKQMSGGVIQPRRCIQGPPPVRYVASAALVLEMASVMNLRSALCQMANAYILAISQYSHSPNQRRNHGSSGPKPDLAMLLLPQLLKCCTVKESLQQLEREEGAL